MDYAQLFATKIPQSGKLSKIADFLLTPLRTLYDGRVYHVIRHPETEKIVQILEEAPTSSKVSSIAKRVISFLVAISFLPVLLGLTLKVICLKNHEYWENHVHCQSIQKNTQLLAFNALSKRPKIPDIFKFATKYQDTNLNDLTKLWHIVGKGREDLETVEQALEILIEKSQTSTSFALLTSKALMVSKTLQLYLKGVVCEFNNTTLTLSQKQQIFLDLADTTVSCPSQWLDTARETYFEIKGLSSPLHHVLSHVQKVKKQISLSIQTHPSYCSALIHGKLSKLLGINSPTSVKAPFKATHQSHTKSKCLRLFLSQYTLDNLIKGLKARLNLKSLDNQIILFMLEVLKKRQVKNPVEEIYGKYVKELEKLDENKEISYLYKIKDSGIRLILEGSKIITQA